MFRECYFCGFVFFLFLSCLDACFLLSFFLSSSVFFFLCVCVSAGCSTTEMCRRLFCVCSALKAFMLQDRLIITDYTTVREKQFLDLLMSNMRETKITQKRGHRKRKKVPNFFFFFGCSCFVFNFLLLLCLFFMCVLNETITKEG